MTQIKIKAGDEAAPKAIVDLIIAGRDFPFSVKLKHQSRKPLVLPSSGINTVIPCSAPVDVTLKSFEQTWVLVTDLGTLATLAKSKSDEFAVVECASSVKAKAVKAATEGAQ